MVFVRELFRLFAGGRQGIAAVEAAQDYGVYQLLFTLIRRNIFYGRKKA